MKILLVDDEPFFIEELKLTIEQFFAKFEVFPYEINFVFSAEDALDIIPKIKPDCIFTDINMASMNGVQLSKKIQSNWPDIKIIIVSGFPSFDSAKKAIQAGVVDFLTKPVYEEEVYHILSQVVKNNALQEHDEIQRQLNYLIHIPKVNLDSDMVKQLNKRFSCFFAIYVKSFEGAYPIDFPFPLPSESLVARKLKALLDNREEVWVLNDNAQGDILIIGLTNTNMDRMKFILSETFHYFSESSIVSFAFEKTYETIEALIDSLPIIREGLYTNLKVGKSQLIDVYEGIQKNDQNTQYFLEVINNKLRLLIHNRKWNILEGEINKVFSFWKKEEISCIALEQNLKTVLRIVGDYAQSINPIEISSIEKRLQEIIYLADSYDEIQDVFLSMLAECIYNNESEQIGKSSKQIFSDIKIYLERNLYKPITLTKLTDTFNISKTQLCSLFRENMNQSFVEYFTLLRMNKAKALITEYPDLLLKEVAEIVGYPDHFYFSKIFKHHVGVPPSTYKETTLYQ